MTFSLHQGWVVMSSQIKQTHTVRCISQMKKQSDEKKSHQHYILLNSLLQLGVLQAYQKTLLY